MDALRQLVMDFLNDFDENSPENQNITTNETRFQGIMPNVSISNRPQMKRQQQEFSRSRFNFHAHDFPHCQ